ncbi:MAG: hypothetical protein WCH31_07150 [Actinomycetes bacterium]
MGRSPALLAVGVVLAGWYAATPHLGTLSLWPNIVLVSVAVMPAVFATVGIVLPLWRRGSLLPATAAFLVATVALTQTGLPTVANFTKLAAATLFGFWAVRFFDELSWPVLIASLIPWVDIYSVFWGPTHEIASGKHEHVFTTLSFAFVVPGGGAARLGIPDLVFFAAFLGSAARFGLRVGWTWIGLTVSVGLTMLAATWWDVGGLPALPGISLGFLVPNADILWRRLRPRR